MKTRLVVAAGVIALVASACGGGRTAPTVATTAGGDGGGGGGDAVAIAEGMSLFDGNCVACHGQGGTGGIGKAIVGSEFVASQSEGDLVAFIKVGREVDDPANSTGTAMPAYGGNTALTDEQLEYIVAYLKDIN